MCHVRDAKGSLALKHRYPLSPLRNERKECEKNQILRISLATLSSHSSSLIPMLGKRVSMLDFLAKRSEL